MRGPDPETIAAVRCDDRAALAWEVLRRDPAYHAAYAEEVASGMVGVAASPSFAARWGCTFLEDPAQACAVARPIWSAAADPRVLPARAVAPAHRTERLFDASAPGVRVVTAPLADHVRVDHAQQVTRIDVISGTVSGGPVALVFELRDDPLIGARLRALRAWSDPAPRLGDSGRLDRALLALRAVDARNGGASLRAIADGLLGPGAWPGDGEHRKSRVRRLLRTGEALVRSGPRPILAAAGA